MEQWKNGRMELEQWNWNNVTMQYWNNGTKEQWNNTIEH